MYYTENTNSFQLFILKYFFQRNFNSTLYKFVSKQNFRQLKMYDNGAKEKSFKSVVLDF